MTHVHPISKRSYRYLLLAIVAGLFYLPVSAQRRAGWEKSIKHDRGGYSNNSPRQNGNSQGDRNRWSNNSNRSNNGSQANRGNNGWNRSERRQPTAQRFPDQRQSRVNNFPSGNRRPGGYGNPSSNNNRFRHNRYPVSAHSDHFRYGSGYRRPVYSPRNPGWRYSYLPRRNSIVASFSFPFATISFGGYSYRYCDGVYYRPYNNVYRVVAPPVGIFINALPFGYSRIYVNSDPYYYYNGTFYDEYEDSYRVVAPPVGALVESIPDGYETITIDGETYYSVDNVQYKPVINEDGEIWYQVIKVG